MYVQQMIDRSGGMGGSSSEKDWKERLYCQFIKRKETLDIAGIISLMEDVR